jgi:hypothetical protein
MAAPLEPLKSERLARHVRASSAIQADDAPVPGIDSGRGKTKPGWLGTAMRDERA